MIDDKKVLALIPARGGSKRLPGKNVKELCGKPLIGWTVQKAKKCNYIDKIIVSTDSEKIAHIAKTYGAEVPFLRPQELATDEAKSVDVINHAIGIYEKKYDIIVLLQPTSPLRTSENLNEAIVMLNNRKAKAIVSVCKAEYPPEWMNTLPEDGRMNEFISKKHNKNSPETKIYYRVNGAIYISDIEYFKKNKGFYGSETFAYVMPQLNSIDIDNLFDFKFSEYLLKEKLKCKN